MIRRGSHVSWSWGNGTATGEVVAVHHAKVTRSSLGDGEITRNGSDDDPALLIEQEDGARVLELCSEVHRA